MKHMDRTFHLFGGNGPLTYALSAFDTALWDIAGKESGLPLWRLLGGAPRAELPAYASLLRYGEPAVAAQATERAVMQGYCYIKLHEIDTMVVHAARAATGTGVGLMVDTNCPWDVGQAVMMAAAMREDSLDWLEEPVWPPEDYIGLARVRRKGAFRSRPERTRLA
jgi:L-alanine-DL-glutamate epimerase-like enolase superfamily enzyme